MQLTWHVFMDKEQGRSATHFVADKGSPGADETRVVGQGPPRLHCLLPTHQHSLRRSHLSHPRKEYVRDQPIGLLPPTLPIAVLTTLET